MARPPDHSTLLDALLPVARAAGDAIMRIYATDFAVRGKDDASPVTEADERAEALILPALARLAPDIPAVSEEEAAAGRIPAVGERFWLVDPLDGTKEFIRRRGDFTVNIAWVEGGTPRRGVVYAPARRRMFLTLADGSSVEETGPLDPEQIGSITPLRVAQADNKALRVVASKSHRDAETDAYIARYEVGDVKSAGSSLKFCLVASGEADLYPRLGRTMEWDTAAGHAVLAGAGGQVLRFDDLAPLSYGKDGFANPFFIACAPSVRLEES